MAGEIATAFVAIMPSFKGGPGAFSKVASDAVTAADTAGAKAGSKFSGSFGKSVAGAGAVMAGFFAVDKVTDFFSSAVSGASDLNETVNKSQVIFGDQFANLDKWSDDSATNLGLSKQAALDAAAGFGDMFSQLGFAGDEAATLSQSVVQMSADLGSFNNLPTEDVSQRIAAAFRGEYDSLQTLIPNINAARVESEAMAATGKKNASQLTAQEKAAAVLAIVNKDGARAMGDFSRTSDGMANRQKILSARFTDLTTTVGGLLLPVLNTLLGVGLSVITFFQENAAVIGIVAGVITAVFLPSLISMAVTAATSAATVVAGWVATAAGAASASLAQGLAVAKMVAGWILMGVQSLLAAAKVALAWLIAMGPIALVIAAVIGLVALIIANFDTIKKWIGDAWDWVKEKTLAVWNAVVDWIKGVPGMILAALTGLWDFVVDQAGKMKDGAIQVWNDTITWVTGLPGKILAALGNLAVLLFDSGKKIIGGLWDGLKSAWNDVVDWFEDKLDWLTGLWPFSPAKHGPLREKPPQSWGENIGSLLAQGLKSKTREVQSAAEGLAEAATVDATANVALGRLSGAGASGLTAVRTALGTDGTGRAAPVAQLIYNHTVNNPYRIESSRERAQAGVALGLFGELVGFPGGGVPIVERA